ncbi:hypothetical protein [Methylobacterium sp. WL116]|uniref:hypothetical protein n=1 Tax=Methylobacterium sp. WL116 TaxID=2603889 RepID=UPI0011C8942E|nr:hypothetical protein [Methylobacterium sp. WL116]TXM91065.1 hypothetical protein FV223_16460 [Methylobacterium sp. WL116]
MPRRWNKFKPMAEYGHLIGSSLPLILDGAIRNRLYGRDLRGYPVEVNWVLIDLFEGRAGLNRADLMAAAEVLRVPRGWSAEFATDKVGNYVAWGLHLGLLMEADGPDGERVWTMPDRQVRYGIIGGKAVQIRGLPLEAQAAMDKRLRTSAKHAATMARRHADRLAPAIAADLSAILDADFSTPIPATWATLYVAKDIMARWPLLKDAFGLLLDVHRDWTKDRQDGWRSAVAVTFTETRGRVAGERAAQAVIEAELAEDAAAFEDMDL